jgi:DNA-binding MarR family transcriptional regulator
MGKTPTRKPDVYLRFLQLSEAIRGLPGLAPLDPLEERMLTFIAAMGQAGQYLGVRELMAHHELGAPATIHSRLKSMRSKGWIQLSDTEDARRKRIDLTREALQHFQRLSRAMLAATASASATSGG